MPTTVDNTQLDTRLLLKQLYGISEVLFRNKQRVNSTLELGPVHASSGETGAAGVPLKWKTKIRQPDYLWQWL